MFMRGGIAVGTAGCISPPSAVSRFNWQENYFFGKQETQQIYLGRDLKLEASRGPRSADRVPSLTTARQSAPGKLVVPWGKDANSRDVMQPSRRIVDEKNGKFSGHRYRGMSRSPHSVAVESVRGRFRVERRSCQRTRTCYFGWVGIECSGSSLQPMGAGVR